jgi:PAS domain S-box-containing protein
MKEKAGQEGKEQRPRALFEAAPPGREEHYRALFNAITDALFVHEIGDDGVPGTFIEVNDVACERLGYTREELLRMSPADIDAPGPAADVRWISRRVLAGECVIFEQTHVTRDGRRIPVEMSARLFRLDERQAVLSLARDVTERKQAEEKLRQSESFIHDILETVDEGFIVIDRDYRVVSANKAYLDKLKVSPEEVIGKHCFALSHHITKPCYEVGENCAVRQTFETGRPSSALHTHHDAAGDPIYVETKSFPLRDASGAVTSVIETITDVTEKRKLEDQLRQAQKMEAVGTLAGGIAHDFNNILSAIIGYGSLLAMKMPAEDPLRLNVERIMESANRAAHLTQGLLAFSRKQIIDVRPVDLNEIMKRVERLLARIIGEDINLAVQLHDRALMVLADGGQIEQVLMNLAANARDAMPSGGTLSISLMMVEIDKGFIKAHGYGTEGPSVLVSVTDTGCGMDQRTMKKIFEPFFTTKEVGKGTGLGLAMAYGIVKQHNGYITVYSEPDKGTTFNIYLPLIQAPAPDTLPARSGLPQGRGETILVAEDDEALRQLTSSVLKEFGYRVIEARHGEEAVSKFQENRQAVQLVILDVVMPVMDGKKAGDEIMKILPRSKVLFLSGYPLDSMRQRGLLTGVEHFLHKPVSPESLLQKVREMLDA